MMWGASLFFFYYVVAQGTSDEINVECSKFHGPLPHASDISPSLLADLRMELVTVGGKHMMNISWAINIDASIGTLTGTRIVISGEEYYCEYNPVLATAGLSSEQKWFHYLVKASYGYIMIQAANLPLPPPNSGFAYKRIAIEIPRPAITSGVTSKPTTAPIEITSFGLKKITVRDDVDFTSTVGALFGGLAGLMILSSCFIIYKSCGTNFANSLGFKKLPTSPMDSIPVLMVYPAENSAFQQAVVALAEFLQWHGGCNVAVDMWQQGKIAELGPMRWLAEQAKAAHRVLIVCPQVDISSSQTSHSPPNHTFPESSIPAATHDLYPLILNMVASHAKSASDLAKFWVVQLGEQQDKNPSNLAPELRACKTFCLVKDLNKLRRDLHTQSQDEKKISDLIFRPGNAYSEKCTVKLIEAVEKLGGHQPSIFREVEPLRSVVCNL
ncbi:interleukin-17 receptor B isoform X2 [Sander vitreus]